MAQFESSETLRSEVKQHMARIITTGIHLAVSSADNICKQFGPIQRRASSGSKQKCVPEKILFIELFLNKKQRTMKKYVNYPICKLLRNKVYSISICKRVCLYLLELRLKVSVMRLYFLLVFMLISTACEIYPAHRC